MVKHRYRHRALKPREGLCPKVSALSPTTNKPQDRVLKERRQATPEGIVSICFFLQVKIEAFPLRGMKRQSVPVIFHPKPVWISAKQRLAVTFKPVLPIFPLPNGQKKPNPLPNRTIQNTAKSHQTRRNVSLTTQTHHVRKVSLVFSKIL